MVNFQMAHRSRIYNQGFGARKSSDNNDEIITLKSKRGNIRELLLIPQRTNTVNCPSQCDECYGVEPYVELVFDNAIICASQLGEGMDCSDGVSNCLNLGNKGLKGPIPDNIGQLNYLEILSLGSNELTGKIPKTVGALTNLFIFTVNGNFLEGEIPESVCNWQGHAPWCEDIDSIPCDSWNGLLYGHFPMYDFSGYSELLDGTVYGPNELCGNFNGVQPMWPSCIHNSPVGHVLVSGNDQTNCPEPEPCNSCNWYSAPEWCMSHQGGDYQTPNNSGCFWCDPNNPYNDNSGTFDNICNPSNMYTCVCMSSTYGCCDVETGCNGVMDCMGVCDGTAVVDECFVCNGDGGPCDECILPWVICATSFISFGAVNDGSLEIFLSNDIDVAGFQFNITGLTITGASGGDAAEAGFNFHNNDNMVLGFSETGATIPVGEGLLVNVSFTGNGEACLENVVLTDEYGIVIDTDIIDGCVDTWIMGDVNGDGELNVVDLIWIIWHIVDPNNYPFTEIQTMLADSNQDGIVDILDVVNFIYMILDEYSGTNATFQEKKLLTNILKDLKLVQYKSSHEQMSVLSNVKNQLVKSYQ